MTMVLVDWQSVDVPEGDRIRVRPGDIIGIHYAKNGHGVVPYEQSDKTSTVGVSLEPGQLSRLFTHSTLDSGLPIGVTKTVGVYHFKRLPALKPVTSCCVEIHNLSGMFLCQYILMFIILSCLTFS